MCVVFKINRSSYYANLNKKVTKTALRHKKVSQAVLETYEAHNKIYETLKKLDIKCSLKLIQKIMQELQIKSITRKKYKSQTSKNLKEQLAENILKQNFKSESILEKIVGDITYIQTKDYGWCYLASFLDLYTNEIIEIKYQVQLLILTKEVFI